MERGSYGGKDTEGSARAWKTLLGGVEQTPIFTKDGGVSEEEVLKTIPEPEGKVDLPIYNEERQEVWTKAMQTIPGGKHFFVKKISKSVVRVSKGAKLTVENLVGTQIIVEDGGEFELMGENLKSEIIYEESSIADGKPASQTGKSEYVTGEAPQAINSQDTDAGLIMSGSGEIKKQIRTAIHGLRTKGVSGSSPIPVAYDEYFKALGFSSVERKDNGVLKVVKIIDGKKVGTNLERAQVEKFLKDQLVEYEKTKDDVGRKKSELTKKYLIPPISTEDVVVSNTGEPIPQGDDSEGWVFDLYPLEQESLKYIQTIRGTRLETNADEYKTLPRQIFKILKEAGVNPKPQNDGTFILEGVSNTGKTDSDPMTKQEVVDFLLSIQAFEDNGVSLDQALKEIPTEQPKLVEIDITNARTPFSISGNLKKSDQGSEVATSVIQESHAEQNVLDNMGIESVPQAQSDTGFGLADVDEFETSSVLSGKKLYSEKDIAESLEDDRTVDLALDEEKKINIQKKLENDLTVKWFDKEAFQFPERSDAVWDRFVATHYDKAILYREDNPGIRSALERKEEKEANVAKKETEPKSEKQKFFDSRFETEFGITKEQISQIEGYERLSEGQQKLVFENLREYARDTRGGITARTWEGILKAVGRDTKDKNYIDAATVLIRNTAQFGPKVHEENGELLVDLVGDVKFNREHRVEEKAVVDQFNARAHEYAKIKAGNFEENTGTKRKSESKIVSIFKNIFSESRQEFDTTEHLYENAKQELVKVLGAQGMSEGQIAERLIQIDNKVHVLRFLQTELEAVDVIKQGTEQTFLQRIGKKFLTNTPYALLGFVGRFATAETMGFFASPVVAGVVGGIRSWDKTSAELRERDRAVRMGEGGTNPKVLELQKKIKNVILERNTLKPASNINDSIRDIELRQWLDRYNADLVSMGTGLNIVDATREIEVGQGEKKDVGLTQKLRDLIHEYQIETARANVTDEEKTKILERIGARVAYVEDKLNLNRINFGSGAERSLHMANLFETLGEAKVLLADAEMPKGSKVEERLEQYLIKREGLIQTRRRMKQIKIAAKDTLIAGSFATAGALLNDYVRSLDLFGGKGVETAPVATKTTLLAGSVETSPVPQPVPLENGALVTDDTALTPKVEVPPSENVPQKEVSTESPAVPERSIGGGDIQEGTTPASRTEEVKAGAQEASSEPAPRPVSGSAPTPNSQIPSSQTSGELQRASVENGDASRLYSNDANTSEAEAPTKEGGGASDIVFRQQAEDSSWNSEEASSAEESQPKPPTPRGSVEQSPASPENVIEKKDVPDEGADVKDDTSPKSPDGDRGEQGEGQKQSGPAEDRQTEADAKSSASREELPKEPLVEGESVVSDTGISQADPIERAPSVETTPRQDLSEYESLRDSFGTEDSIDTSVPDQHSQISEGVSINKHGVQIDETRSNIYKAKTIDGKEILISHGGGDLKSRVDEAYAYAEKNPGTTVYVEGESKIKLFGPDLPPPMIAVTAPTGVVKDVELNIMDFKTERAPTGNIDTNSFTERLTKR